MPTDPRRLYDQKDALIAGLYAKRALDAEDVFPVLTDTAGNLLIAGTLSTTPARSEERRVGKECRL